MEVKCGVWGGVWGVLRASRHIAKCPCLGHRALAETDGCREEENKRIEELS